MPRVPIQFKPKIGPGQERDKITRHSVRAELDGASLGGERSCGVGETIDFGQPEVAEGSHEIVAFITNLDAAGNAGRTHEQRFRFDAKDRTPPGEAVDGEFIIGDPLDDATAATGPESSVNPDQTDAPVTAPETVLSATGNPESTGGLAADVVSGQAAAAPRRGR